MKSKQRTKTNARASTDVFHLLGILARVTRRIVDTERTPKQERKA